MKAYLRICADDYSLIRQHLLPADKKEAIAFALCGRAQSDNRLIFTVHKIVTIPYCNCIRNDKYLNWKTEDVFPLLNEAMNEHMAIMRIHSHPGGWPHFSDADLETDRNFFGDYMNGWCDDGLPHLSAIMLPDGKIIGRVYYSEDHTLNLDSTLVVGEKIVSIPAAKESEDIPPEEALRNIQAFGEGTYNTFKALRIGLVGCSGTGCHVIEQLIRMQVGELVLVDHDIIEAKNLNRLVGAGKDDVGKSKVEFYKTYIESKKLGTNVLAFPFNLFKSDEARRALSTCDILFGCVDSASARMIINTLSNFYLIPYFDMGVALEADGAGNVSYVGAQMDYLIPGQSSLMSRGIIKQDEVNAELEKLFDPEGYEEHKKEHYIKNVQVDRPAVISINGLIAYKAVINLLDRLISFRNQPSYANERILLHEDSEILNVEDKYKKDEYLSKYKGRGDYCPYINMPALG